MSPLRKSLLLCLALALLALGALTWRKSGSFPEPAPSSPADRQHPGPELAAALSRLEAREAHIAQTLWAPETSAQQHFRTIEDIWDRINSATNKLEVFAAISFHEITPGKWTLQTFLPHGAVLLQPTGQGSPLSLGQFNSLVARYSAAGWQLEQVEFRHNKFTPASPASPASSRLYFSAHLLNSAQTNRATIEGDLLVEWATNSLPGLSPGLQKVDASALTIRSRTGSAPFQLLLSEEFLPSFDSHAIDPLILNDLNGDGFSEIILAGRNLVYERNSDGSYRSSPLCEQSPRSISIGIVADFDQDGLSDFLCHKGEGFLIYKGTGLLPFPGAPRIAFPSRNDLQNPMVATAGDVDRDGDVDLFVAQYREPFEAGAIPRPYYDANDGYPAYLLLNDGRGNFTDGTEGAGLAKKRWRRSYSSSFADLDSDGDLDLLVVSDFAGLDLYANNGRGQFSEMTSRWVPESHAFGMAHSVADFNVDGRLDVLMIGMTSPTAERLEHFGLWRNGDHVEKTMRSRMTYGNRLYLGQTEGRFAPSALSDSIARSGWSWGCSAFDVENDGFPDVYIANGLESNNSVREYEPEFWLHDTFIEHPEHNPAAYVYFKSKFSRMRGRDYSYGGYERNRLFLNDGGAQFLEMAHLFGLALGEDCRNVASDDLDGDGRMDLLVTTSEIWPIRKQSLRAFLNRVEQPGNWIGFRFNPAQAALNPQVVLHSGGRRMIRQLVTGDSYRSQHSNTLHFGLGNLAAEKVQIVFMDGQVLELTKPALNRYHKVPGENKKP